MGSNTKPINLNRTFCIGCGCSKSTSCTRCTQLYDLNGIKWLSVVNTFEEDGDCSFYDPVEDDKEEDLHTEE